MMTNEHVCDDDAAGKVAHTPGPWELRPGDDGQCFADVWAPTWSAFARVVVKIRDDIDTRSDGVANARLIAAAPDLLAALELARSYVEFALREGMGEDQDLAAIDAALAKARGHE
jgi:hypothetical protein